MPRPASPGGIGLPKDDDQDEDALIRRLRDELRVEQSVRERTEVDGVQERWNNRLDEIKKFRPDVSATTANASGDGNKIMPAAPDPSAVDDLRNSAASKTRHNESDDTDSETNSDSGSNTDDSEASDRHSD